MKGSLMRYNKTLCTCIKNSFKNISAGKNFSTEAPKITTHHSIVPRSKDERWNGELIWFNIILYKRFVLKHLTCSYTKKFYQLFKVLYLVTSLVKLKCLVVFCFRVQSSDIKG